MENKALKEDGSPCRLPIAGHGLFLREEHRDDLRRTSRAEERRLLLRGRDGVMCCALLCVVILFSFAAVPVSAESPHTVTVSMRPSKGARTVVAVMLNGAGPYDFMVDTGATVTVLDTALFHELGLQANLYQPCGVLRYHQSRKTFKRSGGACHCHAMVPMTSPDVSRSVGRLSRFRKGVRHEVSKSDVNVPHRSKAEIDFIASDPGLSLFHCHMQLHTAPGTLRESYLC